MDLKLTLEPCPLVRHLVQEGIAFAGALPICCALQPQIFEVQLENCRFIAHQEIIEIIGFFFKIVFGVVESSVQFLLVFFDSFCTCLSRQKARKTARRSPGSSGVAVARQANKVLFVYLSLSMPKQQELAGEKRLTLKTLYTS